MCIANGNPAIMARTHLQPFCFKAEILAGNEGGLISMSRCGQACPLNVHYYLATEKNKEAARGLGGILGATDPILFSVRVWHFSSIYTWHTIIYTCHIHM